jgi:hypothetical protein
MLVNGQGEGDWQIHTSTDSQGSFIRQVSTCRHWVTPMAARDQPASAASALSPIATVCMLPSIVRGRAAH